MAAPVERSAVDEIRVVALLVGLGGLAWRTWAATGGWFYSDDFLLTQTAREQGFTLGMLLTPNDSQLMPFGMVLAWFVTTADPFGWWAAALTLVVLQAFVLLSGWWMLRTVFGERWLLIPPLVLLAFCPMAIDTSLWWAAALNGLPAQAAFFVLVTAMVQWSRYRRWWWAGLALGAFGLAVASGPRGALVALPVGLLVVFLLTPRGPALSLPLRVLRHHWPVVALPAVLGVGYLVLYRSTTPAPLDADAEVDVLTVLWTMMTGTVGPSLLGGPWTWDVIADPISTPGAPTALGAAAALGLAVAVGWWVVRGGRRRRVAAAILLVQLAATLVAIAFGRALQLGTGAALNTRYYPDVLAVLVLVLALATMEPSAARRTDLPRAAELLRTMRGRLLAAGLAAFVVSCLVSIVSYTLPWHAAFPARSFVTNAGSSLTATPGPIADLEVPPLVQLPIHFPRNLPSQLLAPYGDAVDARLSGNDLRVLDDQGSSRPAGIRLGSRAADGPDEDCGWLVADEPVRIEIDRDPLPVFPWTAINYAAGGRGAAVVTFDDREPFTIDVLQGPHTWFVNGDGAYSYLTIEMVTPGLTMCVDAVSAGEPAAVP